MKRRALSVLLLATSLAACGTGGADPAAADHGITYKVGTKSGSALKVSHVEITQFSDHTMASVILSCPAFNGPGMAFGGGNSQPDWKKVLAGCPQAVSMVLDMYGAGGAVKPGKYGARKKGAPGGMLGIGDYNLDTSVEGKGYEVTKNDGKTMEVTIDWQSADGSTVKGSFAGPLTVR